jgi:hypothetical protein
LREEEDEKHEQYENEYTGDTNRIAAKDNQTQAEPRVPDRPWLA